MEEFTEATYCFLEKIYLNDGVDSIFELALSDKMFKNVIYYWTDLKGISNILCTYNNLQTDFKVEDGFLKCSSMIRRVTSSELVKTKLNSFKKMETVCSNLYVLLKKGFEEGFRVAILNEDGSISASAPFTTIKFAKTSMSIYVTMSDGKELFNYPLVFLQNGILVEKNFCFLVPETSNFDGVGCKFINYKELNSDKYSLWQVNALPLYATNIVASHCIINKAMCVVQRNSYLLEMLRDYITLNWEILGKEPSDKLPWSTQKSHASVYGLYFKSSIKSIPASDRKVCMRKLMTEILPRCSTVTEGRQYCKSFNLLAQYAMLTILNIELSSGTSADALSSALGLEKGVKELLFYVEMYLYKVRATFFITGSQLTETGNPIIVGGNETYYTIVEGSMFRCN